MSATTLFRNAVLNHMLGGKPYTLPGTIFLSLHENDPVELGAYELSGNGYTRQPIVWGVPKDGSLKNAIDVDFADLPAAIVTHVGIWDKQTKGNLLWSGLLLRAETIAIGNTLRFRAGEVQVGLE